MNYFTFFFLCVFFALLDPYPDPADQKQCGFMRIRIRIHNNGGRGWKNVKNSVPPFQPQLSCWTVTLTIVQPGDGNTGGEVDFRFCPMDGDPTGQIKTRHGILPANRSKVLAKEKNLKRERRKLRRMRIKKNVSPGIRQAGH
jgi:hypothetical protein